jgi:hypothetical protein
VKYRCCELAVAGDQVERPARHRGHVQTTDLLAIDIAGRGAPGREQHDFVTQLSHDAAPEFAQVHALGEKLVELIQLPG